MPPAAEEPPAGEEQEAAPRKRDCAKGTRMNREGECVSRRNQGRN